MEPFRSVTGAAAPLPLDDVNTDQIIPSAYLKDLDADLTGRHVLIVEDIIDSGLTLSWLLANLRSRGPASVEIATMLRKPDAAKVDVDVKYVGFEIPNEFVVGYGLDFDEKYRNLPFVGTLAPHVYGA